MNTNKKTLKPANGRLIINVTHETRPYPLEDEDGEALTTIDMEDYVYRITKSTPYATKQLGYHDCDQLAGKEISLSDDVIEGVNSSLGTTIIHVRDVVGVYDDSTEEQAYDLVEAVTTQAYTQSSVLDDITDILGRIDSSTIPTSIKAKLYTTLDDMRKGIALKQHADMVRGKRTV